MNLSEVCASAYSRKAAMNQFGLLAPTISEIGQERPFDINHYILLGHGIRLQIHRSNF